MHVSCPWFKKRKTVLWHYGPWIFVQTNKFYSSQQNHDDTVEPMMVSWVSHATTRPQNRAIFARLGAKGLRWRQRGRGAISLGGMKDKVKIPTSGFLVLIIMMNHQGSNHYFITSLPSFHCQHHSRHTIITSIKLKVDGKKWSLLGFFLGVVEHYPACIWFFFGFA